MSFISHLSVGRKFALIALLAVLMAVLPASIVVRNDLAKIETLNKELQGIAPAGDLLRVLQLSQQHRGMSALFLGGDASVASARPAKQQELERALEAARATLSTLGEQRLMTQLDALAGDFQTLAASVAAKSLTGPESFARHTAMIAAELALLQDVSHVSGIVLVPDAEDYFLQDAVLNHLPHLIEVLGQVRARGALLLNRGEVSSEDRVRLAYLLDQARHLNRSVGKSLDLAGVQNEELRNAMASSQAQAVAGADRIFKLVDEQILRPEFLELSAKSFFDSSTEVIDAQFALVAAAFKQLGTSLRGNVDDARYELITVVGMLSLLGSLGGWVMWSIARGTTHAVTTAVRVAEAVAQGDLTVEAPAAGRDELGQLLRALGAMQASLLTVVGQVRGNADSVATASAQIAQGNASLSQRTEEQASSLQQTAASMEQLGSTVRQNADNARQASQLANTASAVARQGGAAVSEVVETMRTINESSKRIAEIIGTIDGIAFQTNILALNAAVEAARAGEQGRGFAVVASEVRTLAQRSAEAAKAIKNLIHASVERVELGSALVDRAGATMNEVVQSIQRVNDIVAEISSASGEQSQGVNQIGEAVGQMDRVTQQNAALVEESAAAAESLRQQARQLVDAVAVFKVAVQR